MNEMNVDEAMAKLAERTNANVALGYIKQAKMFQVFCNDTSVAYGESLEEVFRMADVFTKLGI